MPNKISNPKKVIILEKLLNDHVYDLQFLFDDNPTFLVEVERFKAALDLEIIKYKKGINHDA